MILLEMLIKVTIRQEMSGYILTVGRQSCLSSVHEQLLNVCRQATLLELQANRNFVNCVCEHACPVVYRYHGGVHVPPSQRLELNCGMKNLK
jgi:hypothetical protein